MWTKIQATVLSCSTYLVKQRLPLLRQRKKKEQNEVSERVTGENGKKSQEQVPQQSGAPVWKW